MSAVERLKAVAGLSIYNQLAPMFLRIAAVLHLDPIYIQDLKNIKNVKGCRDVMPKSMQTR